jgi:hypothetical protein
MSSPRLSRHVVEPLRLEVLELRGSECLTMQLEYGSRSIANFEMQSCPKPKTPANEEEGRQMCDSVKRYHLRKVLIHWAGISMEDASNHTMFLFEMRSRLKLAFLFNCLEMEAQAPTRSTTSERARKLGSCLFVAFFSSATRKSS